MSAPLSRRLAAETVGTAFLLAAVVGSGIMAERLAEGNAALALLCNALATGAALSVLIAIFAPLSGAHFNPAVTFHFVLHGEIGLGSAAGYLLSQTAGAFLGVIVAHAMFALPLWQVSDKLRDGPSHWLSEFVATSGLLAVIVGSRGMRSAPALVGLYIAAAYWFTASTSFANPAVTLARAFTHSFSGIAPASVPGFVIAQLLAVVLTGPVLVWLFRAPGVSDHSAKTNY